MDEPSTGKQPGGMTPERAQVITDLFQSAHPGAAAEIGHYVDSIIHGPGDDAPDPERADGHSGAAISLEAAQAAAEFVMAAMLRASR
jgi:hypothetical protein